MALSFPRTKGISVVEAVTNLVTVRFISRRGFMNSPLSLTQAVFTLLTAVSITVVSSIELIPRRPRVNPFPTSLPWALVLVS